MPKKKTDKETKSKRIKEKHDPESTMGGRIVTARAARGFTPAQLATRLGVLTKTVKNWESDRSEPRGNKLVTMAGLLGVSVMWLTTGNEPESEAVSGFSAETGNLAMKMDQLLNLHQQASTLILELQGEVNRLQNQIDVAEIEVANK